MYEPANSGSITSENAVMKLKEALAAARQISVSAERVMQAQKHITTHEGRFLPNQVFTTIPPI